MNDRLQSVLNAHRLPCGAVIVSSGEVMARVGDFNAFASAGLVSAILGPYGSAQATYRTVRDPEQSKPMLWSQGSEFALLDCAGEFVVVVFGRDDGDVHARYELLRQVGESIAAAFAGPVA